MPTWLKIILLLIPIYFLICLLIATLVSIYQVVFRKKKFIPVFKESFSIFIFELFDPTNYI